MGIRPDIPLHILLDTIWVYGRLSRYIFCRIPDGYTAGYPPTGTYFAGYQMAMGIRPDIPLPILPDTIWVQYTAGYPATYFFTNKILCVSKIQLFTE